LLKNTSQLIIKKQYTNVLRVIFNQAINLLNYTKSVKMLFTL